MAHASRCTNVKASLFFASNPQNRRQPIQRFRKQTRTQHLQSHLLSPKRRRKIPKNVPYPAPMRKRYARHSPFNLRLARPGKLMHRFRMLDSFFISRPPTAVQKSKTTL